MADEALPALTLDTLREAVAGAGVALRLTQRHQPAGGAGDKVFPPTYETDDRQGRLRYAVETRRIDGKDVGVVLLDSVASQANRIEAALFDAWSAGQLDFPVIGVDFNNEDDLADLGYISALHAPHRIADALLRDALTPDGQPFRDSLDGRDYTSASTRNATAVYRLCPTALVLGVWDSTGPRGGKGAKFQRALVSEVVGVGYAAGTKTASRMDPVGIESGGSIYHLASDVSDWTADPALAQKDKAGRPVVFNRSGAEGKGKASAINHGNITPSLDAGAGGITFDYGQQVTVLSLAALRKLQFVKDVSGATLPADSRGNTEVAARTALAALALIGVALARDRGLDLRSRALLVPETGSTTALELLPGDGSMARRFSFATQDVLALARAAAEAASAQQMAWQRQPLRLAPMPKLVALIRESRRRAAQSDGEADGTA